MIRFSIFAIPVRVEPFFWITLLIVGRADFADSPDGILKIALFMVAGFISILVHELGHAMTARKFGAYSEITLQAFGGYATYSGVHLTLPQSLAVTAAGPLVQILLGGLIFFAMPYLPPLNEPGKEFLADLVWISVVWALLNLLPVLPLDGGRLLETLLGPKNIKITLWVSIITAIGAGVWMYRKNEDILFLLFMGMFAWQSFQALKENQWR
ncbi:MAG: site-2 protease family protein [Akkermansiaceae bacterium]|jgi:Zn-dependent protease|nr:site-2 protease family protein [Akkermansiaceae bacterium]